VPDLFGELPVRDYFSTERKHSGGSQQFSINATENDKRSNPFAPIGEEMFPQSF